MFLPVASGAIIGVSLVYGPASLLGLVGLVPLFVFATSEQSPAKFLLGHWLYGVALWGILLSWIFNLLPLAWAGLGTTSGILFVIFAWLTSVALFALVPAVWALLVKHAVKKNLYFLLFLGLPFWIGLEYVSSWLPTILWKGAGSTLYPITLGHIGYLLAHFPNALLLANYGSIYLLSAFVFFVNICVFFIITRPFTWKPVPFPSILINPPQLLFLFVLVFAAAALIALPWLAASRPKPAPKDKPPLRVALVTSNIPSWSEAAPDDTRRATAALLRILQNISKEKIDLVIFPESSRVKNLIGDRALNEIFRDSDVIVIDDTLIKKDGRLQSYLVVERPRDGTVVASWSKSNLMMGGEYAPALVTAWAKAFGLSATLKQYEANTYSPGDVTQAPVPIKDDKLAISLCTEVWAPQFYKHQKRRGASLLLNLSSDALFHGSRVYREERLRMLKVRAAENNSYLIQAANASPSLVVSPRGKIIVSVAAEPSQLYAYQIFSIRP